MDEPANFSGATLQHNSFYVMEQGLHSRNLFFEVAPHADGFVMTFKTRYDFYKIFFSPSGRITHAKRVNRQDETHAQDAVATVAVVDAGQSHVRP